MLSKKILSLLMAAICISMSANTAFADYRLNPISVHRARGGKTNLQEHISMIKKYTKKKVSGILRRNPTQIVLCTTILADQIRKAYDHANKNRGQRPYVRRQVAWSRGSVLAAQKIMAARAKKYAYSARYLILHGRYRSAKTALTNCHKSSRAAATASSRRAAQLLNSIKSRVNSAIRVLSSSRPSPAQKAAAIFNIGVAIILTIALVACFA
ncbi:MAG: hypothetical protein C4562_07025 [Actinobacteria bacterium]|nr:MAG: hypothetical protein C4562_07025 [Actinomycetota bacterium]